MTKHHILKISKNPTDATHHDILVPAIVSATYLKAAQKFFMTSVDNDDSRIDLGYDYLANLNIPLPKFAHEISEVFGTIHTIFGKIIPRDAENTIKTCLYLAF